jgi:hypothetical protein
MPKVKMIRLILFVFVAASIAFSWSTGVWGHGEGTRIVPASLTVKAGSDLKVTVNGLVGTNTATFRLTGMFGKYELGEFPISSDDFTQVLAIPADFTQVLAIPADAPPGSYRLTVEGGGKSAKVVISVN